MDISKFTIEDFVFNQEFKKWVLHPDFESNHLWTALLLKYPAQKINVKLARDIVQHMLSEENDLAEEEFYEMWANIDLEAKEFSGFKNTDKIIPISSFVNIKKREVEKSLYSGFNQFYRVAAILLVSCGLGMLSALFFDTSNHLPVTPEPIVYEEHITPQGVKSNLTLSDGSNVILNSGSLIRYVKGFDNDKREVFLQGEAYFEVFKDPGRPFKVIKGNVGITALGTSFNIQAYPNEDLNISLLSGKLAVDLINGPHEMVLLEKGDNLLIGQKEGIWTKATFDEEEVLGWTRKIIVFDKTPIPEAIRILENWYGMPFHFKNDPIPGLLLSGKFTKETLENVLEGLSYTTKLEFEIQKDNVTVIFK